MNIKTIQILSMAKVMLCVYISHNDSHFIYFIILYISIILTFLVHNIENSYTSLIPIQTRMDLQIKNYSHTSIVLLVWLNINGALLSMRVTALQHCCAIVNISLLLSLPNSPTTQLVPELCSIKFRINDWMCILGSVMRSGNDYLDDGINHL